MRMQACMFALMAATLPASAQEQALEIELLPGHAIHHESEKEAGVAMALSVTPGDETATDLAESCERLRLAAGLADERGDELRLETIFVVPRKAMAVEGYYLPKDGSFDTSALVRGGDVQRSTLDAILERAGIPPHVLDETAVEHEISCEPGQPRWHVVWQDVRPLGDETPDAVIERAYRRFMAVHQSVVEHGAQQRHLQNAHRMATGG